MMIPTLRTLPPPPPGKTGWPWTEESPSVPASMPSGAPWPRISIVTPSYNQGKFIEETIRSVLLQGYPNLQYCVFDGGSKDETIDILRKYEPWLHWVSEKDRGQAHAINKGLARSDGHIAAYLDSDDYYLPGAFQHVAQVWKKPGFDVFVGKGKRIGQEAVRPSWYLLRRSWWLSLHRPFIAPFVLTRQWWYEIPQECTFWDHQRVSDMRFDESFRFCLDAEWFVRIYSGALILHSSRVVGVFRIHGESKTTQLQQIYENEMKRIFAMYGDAMDRIAAEGTPEKVAKGHRRAKVVALAERMLRRTPSLFAYRHPAHTSGPPRSV
jgi:hypothetical protein